MDAAPTALIYIFQLCLASSEVRRFVFFSEHSHRRGSQSESYCYKVSFVSLFPVSSLLRSFFGGYICDLPIELGGRPRCLHCAPVGVTPSGDVYRGGIFLFISPSVFQSQWYRCPSLSVLTKTRG